MTPEEWVRAFGAAGVGLGVVIKFGDWLFKHVASQRAERRATLETMLERQEKEIERLSEDLAEERLACERRLSDLQRRVEQAERDTARMEGVLYRMGWEKTPEGNWKRNGG